MNKSDLIALLITIAILGIFFGGIWAASNWWSNTPNVKASNEAYNKTSIWYDKQMKLAHSTNDTSVLHSIYIDAINHGADPSYAKHWWCCDSNDPTGVYKYAKDKYEGLK